MSTATTTPAHVFGTGHACHRAHRTHRALARCRWPGAVWIAGAGRYALVTYCGGPREVAVSLWPTLDAARAAETALPGCGHACRGPAGHEVVTLPDHPGAALPGKPRP